MSKRCSVACDTERGIVLCELELPDAATIADALAAARLRLGGEGPEGGGIEGQGVEGSGVDWEHAATGIYGRTCPREHVPADGDRIELYRPLQIDPRTRRRARVAAQKPQRKRPGG